MMSIQENLSRGTRRQQWRSFAINAAASLMFVCGAAAAQTQSPSSQTGFWWKPTESGWGLAVQQQASSTFAVWFTYDAKGAPVWYTLTCAFAGAACTGDLYTATGTPLLQIASGANMVAQKVGTGSLTVTAPSRLSLSYTVGDVTQTKTDLEPQNFVASGVPVCTLQAPTKNGFRTALTNFTDHWWGGVNASGWGLQISHQGNQLFAGWYSYNPQGTATWLTAQGTQDANNARRFTGKLYRVDPGTPFPTVNGPVNPASVALAGDFELNFSDGEHGFLIYSFPIAGQVPATGSLAIERFAVAGGAVNVCTTPAEASRFLAQATFGPRMEDIDALSRSGYDAWFDSQFNKPQTLHLPNVTNPFTAPYASTGQQAAFHRSIWKNFATGEDALRQRVAFALSQIFVVSLNGDLAPAYPRGPANYLDRLGAQAFGNFRTLLEEVTYSPMMGAYLSHLKNQKDDASTGRTPDENFAREVMQLFTIGLYELNQDGTYRRDSQGNPIETYGDADVTSLAKVFTGLSWAGPDTSAERFIGGGTPANADKEIKPMQAYNQFHSTAAKRFLGVTIPATSAADTNGDIRIALDTLFNHPNVGPFIGRQLIQRLVSSNPSPAYVSRVAAIFNNNGSGVRGDMKAVIKAVLLDPEARATPEPGSTRGKIREPVVRMVHWMRAFNASSRSGGFLMTNTADPDYSLGQFAMYAPSVFNFYRPSYVPPNSRAGNAGLVLPEMQIMSPKALSNYMDLVGYAVSTGVGERVPNNGPDIFSNYASEVAVVDNLDALVNRVNLLLTAGNLSTKTRTAIRDAVASIVVGGNNGLINSANLRSARVSAAIYLTMISPEYIFQP